MFLLTDLLEIEPVSMQSKGKKARGCSFHGNCKTEAGPSIHLDRLSLHYKTVFVNETAKWRQRRLISTWIHSPKNDGQNQKVSSASAARDKLSRASSQDNSFKSQYPKYQVKSSD